MNKETLALLDTAHLDAYTSGDIGLQIHVLSLFLENVPEYISTLSKTDSENWKANAHKLKGAARGVGACKLANVAEQAEKLGYTVKPEDKDNALDEINAVFLETRAFIETHYLQDTLLE